MTLAYPALLLALLAPPGVQPPPVVDSGPQPAAVPAARPEPSQADRHRGAALLERAVEALGGAAAVDEVRSLAIIGSGTRQVAGSPRQVKTAVHIVFPGRYRQELTLEAGKIASVLNPDGAFLATDSGTMPLPESERQALQVALGRSLVALLQARRALSPVWTGTSTGGDGAGRLELVSVGGHEVTTLGIDADSGLVHEIRYTSAREGQSGLVRIVYSDYRAAGKIRYPFAATGTLEGTPLFASTLEAVDVNPALPDSLFATPPAEPEAPAAPAAAAPPSKP